MSKELCVSIEDYCHTHERPLKQCTANKHDDLCPVNDGMQVCLCNIVGFK